MIFSVMKFIVHSGKTMDTMFHDSITSMIMSLVEEIRMVLLCMPKYSQNHCWLL